MSPVAIPPHILKRDDCDWNEFNQYRCYNSAWDGWARWVVLVIIVILFFLVFLSFSCVSARRRRRLGQRPFYGTGWAAGTQGNNQYNPNGTAAPYYSHDQQQQHWAQPAPPYTPQPTYGGGYYGGQQSGIELQQPPYQNMAPPPVAHTTVPRHDQDNVYAPPSGPPPGKNI